MGIFDRLIKPKKLAPYELSKIGVDMHSHLLPGIDDGSKNMEETLRLIQEMRKAGFQKIITTPHILWDFYKNNSTIIKSKCNLVNTRLEKEGIDFRLEAAAEYFVDNHFVQLVQNKDLLTFGEGYILIEMGFMEAAPMLKQVLFELQSQGLKPILAHPERYAYWHHKISKFEDLYERGVFLQVNAGSLAGAYGPQVKKFAEKLIDRDIIQFIGTDCHREDHLGFLYEASRTPAFHKLADSGRLLNSSL